MADFGSRPEDVVTDTRGNVQPDVTLTFYATEADALAETGSLGSATTDASGRWTFTDTSAVIYVRTPAGDVYPCAAETGSGVSDATASTKGAVRLTGDLGGTADSPTVPGLAGKAASSHTHAAADIASGTIAAARLGTGTPSSSNFLRGDGAWAGAATAGAVIGNTARNYQLLSGVIRNSGSGWAFLDNTSHRPTNFGAITAFSDRLEIAYGSTATYVSSFQVTPDETLTSMGVRCGASVGTNKLILFFYTEPEDQIADYVYYDGTSWVSFNGVFTGLSYSAGTLTLTHADMGTTGHQAILATPRGTAAALAGSYGATTSQVNFYTGSWGSLTATGAADATQHKVHVARLGRRQSIPAADPASVVAASGNIWITGVIEV